MTRPTPKGKPKACRVYRVRILHGRDRVIDVTDWDDEAGAVAHAKFVVLHGFLGAGGMLTGCEAEIVQAYRLG